MKLLQKLLFLVFVFCLMTTFYLIRRHGTQNFSVLFGRWMHNLYQGHCYTGMDKNNIESVKRILILSYQRSGSSFLGRIFNDSEKIFYVYEPLAPLYGAMYGLSGGETAVPSDIFNNNNGSFRSIPKTEQDAINWMLDRIFTCNMSSLPLAILAHDFWFLFKNEMTHAERYTKCLKANVINAKQSLHQCHANIKDICGSRFGVIPGALKKCGDILWGDPNVGDFQHYLPNCEKYRNNLNRTSLPAEFKAYFQCLIDREPALRKCAAKYLDKPCKEKKVRAMKTVRANMKAGEYLLKSHCNSLLIHLYRDPRGAVRSRLKYRWSQGLGNTDNLTKESLLYCSQVLNDMHMRTILENQGYRDRILEVVYDRYMEEPLKNLLKTYEFIGEETPVAVKENYIKYEEAASKTYVNQWKHHLTAAQENVILKMCFQFYKETTYRWSGIHHDILD